MQKLCAKSPQSVAELRNRAMQHWTEVTPQYLHFLREKLFSFKFESIIFSSDPEHFILKFVLLLCFCCVSRQSKCAICDVSDNNVYDSYYMYKHLKTFVSFKK